MSAERRYAAIDVGSNTIRLLVARVEDGTLEAVLDRSAFIRLGSGVDKTGSLEPERMDRAVEAIEAMADEARSAGAGSIVATATSAVREAANGRDFVARVRDTTGVDVQIVSGEREAQLTYLGATLGIEIEGETVVCDLGGGSAEIIAAGPDGMRWGESLKLGSGRLTERFVAHDPPTAEELDAVAAEVDRQLDTLPDVHPTLGLFTGGTASHIALLARKTGTEAWLTPAELTGIVDLLRSHPAEWVVKTSKVQPERARVLPAGARAVQAIAAHYAVTRLAIVRRGIREGMIVDKWLLQK